MGKQKSYVVTDAADKMAAEIAEANGLTKSSLIEILIRQAQATGWTVAEPLASPQPYAKQRPKPIVLASEPMTSGLRNILREMGAGTGEIETWQDIARMGKQVEKMRGLGAVKLKELKAILSEKGCPLL